MRNTRRLSVRSLLLTAAFTFALGAPFTGPAAQEEEPPGKPPQIEKPEAAEKPPAEEPEPAPARVPEEEPEKEPAAEPEAPPAEEPEAEKPAEPAPPGTEPEEVKPAPEKPAPVPGEAEPAPEEKPAEEVKPEEEEAEAVSPKEAAIAAVVAMSQRLAKLDSFTVKAGLAWEQVLDNGEKILALEQVRADVSRPYGLRMERLSPSRERVLFYNGEQAVLWGPVTRYYAVAPFDGTIAELVTHLAEEYGFETPLADLFMWGHDKAQIEAIEQANRIGQDLLGGRVCDHYAFRQEGVDWQVWIDTGKGGLPCGYAIIDLSDPARPLFLAMIEIEPEAEFNDRRFTFDPPEDAAEIPLATIRPRKDGPASKPEDETAPEEEAAPKVEEKATPEDQLSPDGEAAPEKVGVPEGDESANGEEGKGKSETGRNQHCPCKMRQDMEEGARP